MAEREERHQRTREQAKQRELAQQADQLRAINDKIRIRRVVARMRMKPVVLTFAAWKELVHAHEALVD
eukprot:CAMPEP_0174720938 /NCGR_PEP_ID=MMETSP1094-20130205/34951_1 /TAXON_ID=156173 /ORGANISM="Chrysochromulina brevifilum, Strain UTEX LB 985" /LENGTH=67 /DNA_ID=CAMNT_0015921527 /DNA_START=30 /DNA_END=233 /DNA_ORIENTATION=-